MRFSIYALRADPDWAIFDQEIATSSPLFEHERPHPPIAPLDEYDCAGVFEVEGAEFWWKPETGSCCLGVLDEWMLNAQSVLCGDFTDKDSGNTARITQLWP